MQAQHKLGSLGDRSLCLLFVEIRCARDTLVRLLCGGRPPLAGRFIWGFKLAPSLGLQFVRLSIRCLRDDIKRVGPPMQVICVAPSANRIGSPVAVEVAIVIAKP